MKKTRTLAAAAGALALVTGAASLTLLGGGTASAAGEPSSAFGLSLNIAGTDVIAPTPAVVSTDGSVVTDSLITLPDNPIITGGVVEVSAENGKASAGITGLNVGGGLLQQVPQLADLFAQLSPVCDALDQIPLGTIVDQIIDPITGTLLPDLLGPIVEALDPAIDLGLVTAIDLSDLLPDQLGDLCNVVVGNELVVVDAVTASCNGNTGNTVIAGLRALGLTPTIDTNQPNQSIAIPGVLELTINRQTANADGTFTVDGLYLNLLDQIELTASSATCGNVTTNVPSDPSDAPSPTPVESHVPVTG